MNINITGGVRLTVNDDPARAIAFDPEDVCFVESFYGLIGDLEAKRKEFESRAAALDKDTTTDAYGIPKNVREQIALLKDLCSYMRGRIDAVFGEGTSRAAFGDANSLVMFQQFFEGIAPHIQKARGERISKYTNSAPKGVMR